MTVLVHVVIATASEAWREAIPSFVTYATASSVGEAIIKIIANASEAKKQSLGLFLPSLRTEGEAIPGSDSNIKQGIAAPRGFRDSQ
jgi:predicted RNase H-like HicB family nuclease